MKNNKSSKLNKIKKTWLQVQKSHKEMEEKMDKLRLLITDATAVTGDVHYLSFNGFGFTPKTGDNRYISINELIQLFESGLSVNEKEILDKLYFLPYQLPLSERKFKISKAGLSDI